MRSGEPLLLPLSEDQAAVPPSVHDPDILSKSSVLAAAMVGTGTSDGTDAGGSGGTSVVPAVAKEEVNEEETGEATAGADASAAPAVSKADAVAAALADAIASSTASVVSALGKRKELGFPTPEPAADGGAATKKARKTKSKANTKAKKGPKVASVRALNASLKRSNEAVVAAGDSNYKRFVAVLSEVGYTPAMEPTRTRAQSDARISDLTAFSEYIETLRRRAAVQSSYHARTIPELFGLVEYGKHSRVGPSRDGNAERHEEASFTLGPGEVVAALHFESTVNVSNVKALQGYGCKVKLTSPTLKFLYHDRFEGRHGHTNVRAAKVASKDVQAFLRSIGSPMLGLVPTCDSLQSELHTLLHAMTVHMLSKYPLGTPRHYEWPGVYIVGESAEVIMGNGGGGGADDSALRRPAPYTKSDWLKIVRVVP